jgi:hypothetical protein
MDGGWLYEREDGRRINLLETDIVVRMALEAREGKLTGLDICIADFAPRLGNPCSHPHRSAEQA